MAGVGLVQDKWRKISRERVGCPPDLHLVAMRDGDETAIGTKGSIADGSFEVDVRQRNSCTNVGEKRMAVFIYGQHNVAIVAAAAASAIAAV